MKWTVVAFLVGCTGDKTEEHSGPTPVEAQWTEVGAGFPSALLSVTGTSADDVWSVGSDAAGTGPLVVHWDGAAWTVEDVGSPGDLWWSWLPGPDAVWIVGAGGRIVRYTPSAGTSTVDVTDPAVTFFGLWGSSPTDVYAVGGNLVEVDGAAVYHYDGTAWTEVVLPAEAAGQRAMYKVWGSGPDDVWVCGVGGVVIHWDGVAWTSIPTGSTVPLFTVAGSGPDDVWVVGGAGNGVALHWDGAAFTDQSPEFVEILQGVNFGDDGASIVGWGGRVFTADGDTLTEDPRGRATAEDLHAVWIDPDGGSWMVGGNLGGVGLTDGTLVYGGDAPPAPLVP